MVGNHLASSGVLLIVLLLSSSWAETTAEPESYIDAFGKYKTLADRLNELIGVEEPLAAADIAHLTSKIKLVCAVQPSNPKYQLTVSDLVKQYSKGESAVFDNSAVEQACAAIMACQLDSLCSISEAPSSLSQDPGSVPVTNMLRVIAAAALFVEGLIGVYVPVLLKSVEGYEWWLSLLNCFSGGVFLAAGLVHLLPHCAEAQAKLGPLVGNYPLYLVLITLGYMLVLFVERVLFDVHGSAHGHGPHTGIAPPCVDCRTLEVSTVAGSSEGGRSLPDGFDDGDSGEAVVAANGVDPTLTPGRARYNLRSRGAAAAVDGGAASAGAADLSTPLLAADAAATAAASPSPSKTHCSHGHDHQGHGRSAAAAVADHGHDHGHHGPHQHQSVAPLHHHAVVAGDMRQGVVLLVAMVVHTFLECMALGLMDMRKEFLMLFLAIASHKLISGLALSSRFLKDGATTKQITLYVGPFTLVAPSAILVGMFVRDVNPIVTLALSCFATGTFIYVGASEIVEEEFEGDMRSGRTDISQVFARWCKFVMLLLGVSAIAGLSLIPDAHNHAHNATGHFDGHSHHHHHHH